MIKNVQEKVSKIAGELKEEERAAASRSGVRIDPKKIEIVHLDKKCKIIVGEIIKNAGKVKYPYSGKWEKKIKSVRKYLKTHHALAENNQHVYVVGYRSGHGASWNLKTRMNETLRKGRRSDVAVLLNLLKNGAIKIKNIPKEQRPAALDYTYKHNVKHKYR